VDDDRLLLVLREAADAVAVALGSLADWGPAGTRPGQYRLDLVSDAAALDVLHGAGLRVLSEESGITTGSGGSTTAGAGELLVVLDPVDGSTNASRHLPWYATSLCVLDEAGPRVSLVRNLATGTSFEAVRDRGAWRDGIPIRPSHCECLEYAVVAISGFPRRHPGWAQFRALGAASLDLCAVADGTVDAYLVVGGSGLHSWDYLGALLVCQEAGAVATELSGLDLVARDDSRRFPAAAATATVLEALVHANV
jgi:myo-inositol-1(or 4)-monophosphatase